MKRNMLISFFIISCFLMSWKGANKRKVICYSLPQFSSYLVNVNCSTIKTKSDLKVISIVKKENVNEIFDLFKNSEHFIEDTIYKDIDVRCLIELHQNNKVVEKICWSPIERIQINNRTYTYDKKVEDILLKNKLIVKMLLDTIEY